MTEPGASEHDEGRLTQGPQETEKSTIEVYEPAMSRSQTTRYKIWRSELLGLIDDARACKRRRWSLPAQLTVALALLSACAYSLIGIYVYDHSDPRPDRGVRHMYVIGAIVEVAFAALLLLWWSRTKKSSDHDLDDLVRKLERIDRDSPVETVNPSPPPAPDRAEIDH